MSKIPWIEAYRPTEFDNIVLDPLNKQILKNIIKTSYFPNVLFYGPPGTGKTTTIINLINSYQAKVGITNKDLIIHLNASDERGIDIIRNQISFFVNSKPLFHEGMKFVILDEVDYMTKNAQQALKYLLQNYSNSVRFCLICNYISKIDEGLQNEFMRLRFNQLPQNDIIKFLKNISIKENLIISEKILTLIQKLFKSDIRSMINFMQSKQDIFKNTNNNTNTITNTNNNTNTITNTNNNTNTITNTNNPEKFEDNTEKFEDDKLKFIIDDNVWETITNMIKNKNPIDIIEKFIYNISINYNIDKKNIIKDYLNYIIRSKPEIIKEDFLNFVENIMHSQDCNNKIYLNYSLSKLSSFI
jgi:DNA polymerase III delta prime subunit